MNFKPKGAPRSFVDLRSPKRPLIFRLRAKLRHVRLRPFKISLPCVAYQNLHKYKGLVKLQLYCGQLVMCLGAKLKVQPSTKLHDWYSRCYKSHTFGDEVTLALRFAGAGFAPPCAACLAPVMKTRSVAPSRSVRHPYGGMAERLKALVC